MFSYVSSDYSTSFSFTTITSTQTTQFNGESDKWFLLSSVPVAVYGILTVLYCTVVVHRVRGTCCVWDMSMATWREPAVYTTNTRKSRTRSSGHALPYAIKFRYISLHRSSGAHAGGGTGGARSQSRLSPGSRASQASPSRAADAPSLRAYTHPPTTGRQKMWSSNYPATAR